MRTRSLLFLRYWVPVLIWLSVIFINSTDLLSAEHTSRIIGPILRWFAADISPESVAQIQFVVRKAAHVSEYAILSLLIFRALWQTHSSEWVVRAAALTLVFSAGFAVADEFHQSFVPSRTASLRDVIIDIGGAIIGLSIYWAFAHKTTRAYELHL